MNPRAPGLSLPWRRLIAELAVIVAGVLIALADSWWEQRQERRRAEEYLQQLLVDFRATERQIQAAIAGDTRTFEIASGIADRASRGRFPPPDSLELPTGYHQFGR